MLRCGLNPHPLPSIDVTREHTIEGQVSRFEFETQAASFDDRASMGEAVAEAAAKAILARMSPAPTERIVEIGAGTGEIGSRLARDHAEYVGLDASEAMLEVFRRRSSPLVPRLCVADANARWPFEDASVRGVYLARVLHLLDREHVMRELSRVALPRGLVLLLGRRVRERSAPAARLRRELHQRLRARGHEPRRAERDGTALVDSLLARGADRIAPEVVARRTVRTSFRIELDAWRNKGGLAGLSLPEAEREAVLDELERWARAEVTDLEAPVDADESYVIEGAIVPGRSMP